MEKLVENIQEIRQDVKHLIITTVKQQAILDEHVRRSETAEKTLALLDRRCDMLEKRFFRIDGAAKMIGILVGGITLIDVILKILSHLK